MAESKHSAYDLAQMQSLSLDAKIRMTQYRIREWYEAFDGNVYVSISGGKDSQVLAHLVKDLYPDVPLVFVNTGLEYDSVRLKGIELADEVLKPKMDFVNVIKKYGYPIISKDISLKISRVQKKSDSAYLKFFDGSMKGKSMFDATRYRFLLDAPFRISNECCHKIKQEPTISYEKENGSKPIIGIMATESYQRQIKWMKNGCNAFETKRQTSQPLSFWTEQDILQYIKRHEIQIASIYGDVVYQDEDGMTYDNSFFNESMELVTTGMKRTGCAFCLFGITQDSDRLQKLKKAEPKKYDFVMRGGASMMKECGFQTKVLDISS